MKNKLVKAASMAVVLVMVTLTGTMNAQAAEVNREGKGIKATLETKCPKVVNQLKDLKKHVGGLVNIDLGKLDKVDVSTKDDVKVVLENSNVNVNINLLNVNVNINQKEKEEN